jgi:RNA polymerase sigma-70 factor, ECF subfamily
MLKGLLRWSAFHNVCSILSIITGVLLVTIGRGGCSGVGPLIMTEDLDITGQFSDEEALVAALKRGETAAFEVLVRRYGDYLYRVALRITRNEANARDVVQEAYLSAFRKMGGFEARASLKTWLHRLVVNAALMRLRSIERKGEVSIDGVVPEIGLFREEPEWTFTESVETALARDSIQTAVRRGIDALPEPYRTVLLLRDIEGYDTREVAEMLTDTEGNVKVRLHRARAALKKSLEPLYRGEGL